jgi:aspartate-semialdehyde dehydrogenase
MLTVLEERGTEYSAIKLLASAASAGRTMTVRGEEVVVEELIADSFAGVDVALFSAGGSVSRQFAPIAAKAGCVVIDNSSAWRMDPEVPLVVPEVNPADVAWHKNIIANPNCSTIQLVVALKPLHDAYGLRRVVVSTYQSPSGAGQKGVDQLEAELEQREPSARISSHPLAYNTVFHSFDPQSDPDGQSTEEESKVMRETRRILHLPHLPIAVTCVRVPVLGGHSESVAIEFEHELPSLDEIRKVLVNSPGIVLVDDPSRDLYPTPLAAGGTDAVAVGRIRRDPSLRQGLLMWVVADNLRKGAATNAVQILELLDESLQSNTQQTPQSHHV